jgi:NAD(P)-dependent dehydrogenase (short-subunit alcohol dehydrogenase family)
MSGRVDGKRVLITGAARGMGRSHAVRLAEEGADLILVDICEPIPVLEYSLSTREDLNETARLAEKHGVRVVTHVVDVRDGDALAAAVNDGVAELGGLDASVANAGVLTVGTWDTMADGGRRQPHRNVEHLRRGSTSPSGAGRQRDQHQLGGRPEGHAAAFAVHGLQTRCRRPESGFGE